MTFERLLDRWHRDDHGATSLSMVIAMFGFMLIFGVLLQATLFFHGRDVANTCAEAAMQATRSQYGNAALGTAAGYACIADLGTGDLKAPVVAVSKSRTDTTVTITGTTPSFVPGLHWPVTTNHTKPTERVTNPGGLP